MLSALALGGLVGAIAAPTVTHYFGRPRSMFGCLLLLGLSVMLLQYVTSLWSWAALRFLFGVAIAPVFVLGESWINVLASDAVRGRVVAIYSTSFTLSQVLGPPLVDVLMRYQENAFLICGGLFLLGTPVMLLAGDEVSLTKPHQGHDETDHHLNNSRGDKDATSSWLAIMRTAPALIAGVAFFALFDNVALSFLPLFALDQGFSQSRALTAVTLVLAGDATLQLAVGWLADRYGRARIHLLCGVFICLLLPLLSIMIGIPGLWMIYFYLLGGIAGSIYTLCLIASGERFSGTALLRASGLMSITWNISSSTGSAATGVVMQWFGAAAVTAVLWLVAAGFVITLWLERNQPPSMSSAR
jgi:MFS family permease